MNAECSSNAQQLSSTTINTLPQTITENILCLLPIEEAARTSILSREWRYKWTTIPKLKFYWSTLYNRTTEENQHQTHKLFNAIHQVLLMRQGPIHEFTFHSNKSCHFYELDQIIFHLSRNHTVKKLTLAFDYMDSYKLPLCAFSLHQLTDLDLCYVNLDHQPIFSGFGSLRSLSLIKVKISTKAFLHLLSNCPSLKRFNLQGDIGSKDCTIIELFECLPAIEHLTIWGNCAHLWLVLDSIPKELPTTLIHLKCFRFNNICFVDDHGLTFLAVLIKCSPNLEKIELEICIVDHNEICCGILEEYSDVRLEHLKELEIMCFSNLKHAMEFVKFILARSPKLKRVILYSFVEKDEESDILTILSQAPHASQEEIVVRCITD
ncbi:putative F-box domain-containing protein [Helianthus annuus]|uniref:F-box domain, FBD domain, F-box-like domain superfamily protein n=1 Tax=Helianthus annuus TaxID=4232 RepID=A0A251SGP6_HELAN|nr:F-box/FBD/LRR-repeat protein At1g13570 [Helianthus annuus]XP_022009651.1 F-box/FBD/LRR-repeat protein At1g13570 [Helianthus annuus]XP_022009652.1 F-box/FBD/LRR-repeat protein At1g13570 [Helianthus annuus]KAF5768848.1 putative F-box domain, FBD domain, F-box-like domain superfamily protein [Helianthus annuus]KAJ0464006.1 putative F-box domain, leucine-rich repeat domain superfamily, F-box-like domain superfamily [Helianthus annuus]KAJ0468365.1 putative F-box domain-containing protein [Helian